MRAFFLVCATAGIANAGTNEISVGETTRALRSRSADAMTTNSLDGGTLTYAHALAIDTVPDVDLWAEAALDWGGADGSMFQTLTTKINSSGLMVAGRARYALHPRVAASARLAIGAMRTSLRIEDTTGRGASDHGMAEQVTGSLALDVQAIRARRLSLGVRLELGYVEATSVALVAHADTVSDGTLMLPMQDASLGKLDLSGPSFGVTVFSQF